MDSAGPPQFIRNTRQPVRFAAVEIIVAPMMIHLAYFWVSKRRKKKHSEILRVMLDQNEKATAMA